MGQPCVRFGGRARAPRGRDRAACAGAGFQALRPRAAVNGRQVRMSRVSVSVAPGSPNHAPIADLLGRFLDAVRETRATPMVAYSACSALIATLAEMVGEPVGVVADDIALVAKETASGWVAERASSGLVGRA